MNNKFMVERVLVAASKAQSDGFENTSAALREIAKLWNDPRQLRSENAVETLASVS